MQSLKQARFVLASSSPRRSMLLTQLGLAFTVDPSTIDEVIDPALAPAGIVESLADQKAADVAARHGDADLVLGADTIVVLEERKLGKPADPAEAHRMLRSIAGRWHQVYTGYSLIAPAVRGVVREVIVADGGSSDATLEIADAAGAHIIAAPRDRASQMIAGAAAARSDWLLFLHPETALEQGWDIEAESFLDQARPEQPRAAVFRFALEDFGGEARRAEAKAALRHMVFGLPYGDQGLLVPRRLYQKTGGYRALDRMEDADLVRRIGRRRIVTFRGRAINAARPTPGVVRGLVVALLHTLHIPSRVVAKL